MSLIVHLTLVFHVFIAVAVMVMVCGHHGTWYRPSGHRGLEDGSPPADQKPDTHKKSAADKHIFQAEQNID